MSDAYSTIFSSDPRTGALSYPQLEARRRIAIALATRNRPYPKTIGEGLTALGEGLGEGYMNSGLERAEVAQQGRDAAARPGMYGVAPAPVAPVAPGRVSEAPTDNVLASYTGAASEDGQPVKLASLTTEEAPQEAPTKPAGMSNEEWNARIRRNESGGQRDPYRAIGPVSRRGDHGYGAYQVMGENIPKWTKQYVGREMTPQEFLQDDKAQDIVATGQGGKYRAKYGDDGAARAWFAGEKGMNDPNRKDTLGTHVAEYSRRFNIPMVTRDQVVASAAKNPNAFAAAPQMPPEAANAMAYAPEGAAAEGAEGLGTGMLANLTNPQAPGLGLRGPSDSTFPAPAAPAVSRDAIAASVAAQNGVTPPVQVAAGPAPLPQAPPALPPAQPQVAPALQRPAADPQPEDPGPRPKIETYMNDPKRKAMINAAMQNYHSNFLSPQAREEAAQRLQQLQKEANDEYTKDWTVWHEKDSAKRAFALKERERQMAEETHRQAKQGTITGAEIRQPVDPGVLGTKYSPQRTGIPSPEPKPEGISLSQHSADQEKKMSAISTAVDKAEQELPKSLELIRLARTHPGREWGLGGPGSYLRENPWAGDAYAFGAINKQLASKNFMAAYQDLKGAGAIGVKEGQKGEEAQGSVDPNMKKEHYDPALQRLEDTLRGNVEAAQRKANRPVTAWGNGPNDPPAPDIGQPGTFGGKPVIYIGGDPSKETSYKAVR